jgi:hypothetical protein
MERDPGVVVAGIGDVRDQRQQCYLQNKHKQMSLLLRLGMT